MQSRHFPHGRTRHDEIQRLSTTTTKPRSRQFFANPGPTNVPDSVLRAINRPSIDFRDPDFRDVHDACFEGAKRVLQTQHRLLMCTGCALRNGRTKSDG